MKTTITAAIAALLLTGFAHAQDVTTVNATSSEISDNLDLRAVASIFGDSENLEDFERRLNDPELQISNLDLNNDYKVDYLRVIESVQDYTHLIVVQAVLGKDLFQDVATIEVERDRNNNVQVQVVGDVYMYGQNYIYEPVYVHRPVIYTTFWNTGYRPYYSNWYWGYYPQYYTYWEPYPVFRYRRNVHVHINVNNHYNYVNTRRSSVAVAMYNPRRNNAYERQYPNRAFSQRNSNVANRYELDQKRDVREIRGNQTNLAASGTRNNSSTRSNTIKNNGTVNTRDNSAVRANNNTSVRNNSTNAVRNNTSTPKTNSVRSNNEIRTRNNNSSSSNTVRNNTATTPRSTSNTAVRNTAPAQSQVRSTPNAATSQRSASQPQANRSMNAGRASQQSAPQRAQVQPRAQQVQRPAPTQAPNQARSAAQPRQAGRSAEGRR